MRCISYEAHRNCVSKISSSSGPCGRYGHRTVCFANKMVLYGGYNGIQRFSDTFVYNIVSKKWKKVKTRGIGPGCRDCHSSCLFQGKMIIFGGGNGESWLRDLLSYDIEKEKWTKLPMYGKAPSARAGHSAVIYKNEMFLFGGWDGVRTLNDLHSYNFFTHQWKLIKPHGKKPQTRDSHQSVIYKDRMIIVGGGDRRERLGDMWVYSISKNRWTELEYDGEAELGRAGHILRLYEKRDKLLMFGGGDGNAWIKNIYEFDLRKLRWTRVNLPGNTSIPASYGASGELYRNKFLIFGGGDGYNWYDDVYEYEIEKHFKNHIDQRLFDLYNQRKLVDVKITFSHDEEDYDDDMMDCTP